MRPGTHHRLLLWSQRLAGGEWFTTRISCCGLLPTAYRVSPESQREDLRSLFRVLSQDDTPMVRRAAAQSLSGIAEVVEPQALSQDICPIFLKLTQDGVCASAVCLA